MFLLSGKSDGEDVCDGNQQLIWYLLFHSLIFNSIFSRNNICIIFILLFSTGITGYYTIINQTQIFLF